MGRFIYLVFITIIVGGIFLSVTGQLGSAWAQTPPSSPLPVDPATDPNINPFDIRKYVSIEGSHNLIDFQHPIDPKAPQLTTLIDGNPNPTITNLYQVYEIGGGFIQKPSDAPGDFATAVGLASQEGQNILVPNSGYDLGGGYQAMVLYAAPDKITINYTASGDVNYGYSLHLENLNVNPEIVALYNQGKTEGKNQLVALPSGAVLGTAKAGELRLIARDTGSFMDPRWKNDWWQSQVKQLLPLPPKLTPLVPKAGVGANTAPLRSYPEESEEACSRQEGPWQEDPNTVPIYRKAGGSEEDEMRRGAGLDFNTFVRGAHCGQTKSDPILLKEVAPYRLLEEPKCKVVRWMGEIQLNYSAPPEVKFRLPFAEELADQWAGTWDPEHVSEAEMTSKETLAFGQPDTGSPGQFQAAREIQQRTGVLKKLLPQAVQDELKCQFINYVQRKGAGSMYANFTVDGVGLADIACPPTVTSQGRLDQSSPEYQRWFTQWGKTWKKLGLFPNERATGELKFAVCDDRQYILPFGYPEVFRLGLTANKLWQLFTPKDQQDAFYQGSYADMRNPLASLALGGARLPRRPRASGVPPTPGASPPPGVTPGVIPTPGPSPPPPAPADQPELRNWPRPANDNGRCVHFLPRGYYSQRDFDIQIPRLKELGVKWVLALYQDENQLRLAAQNFSAAGITPVWRRVLKVDQAPTGYPWGRDIGILKEYGLPPYIQLYNEPGDPREYNSGNPNFGRFINNFITLGEKIQAAGGKVGLQLMDPGEVDQLVSAVKARQGGNADNFFNNMFFIPHSYAENHPPGWNADEIGVMGFRFFADAFQKSLGFVPPFIVGEGGWGFGSQKDATFPAIDDATQAKYYQELYGWFRQGQLSDGAPLPDYLFAFCPWILDATGTEWESQGWYGPGGADKTQTIEAIKSVGPFIRKFSWDKQGGNIKEKIQGALSGIRSFWSELLPRSRAVFAQTIKEVPIFAQARRLLAQSTGNASTYDCGSLACSINVVSGDPNNFVYELVISRTNRAPPGVLGDIQINPPKNYEEANPGKTGPHIQSMVGEELRFLSNYEGAEGFMPRVKSVDELRQYTWTVSGDRLPEGYKFHDVSVSYGGAAGPPGGGPAGPQCRETATCRLGCNICNRAQMAPSDTESSTYNKSHVILGVDWPPQGPAPNPVKLTFKIPDWTPGTRPLPAGCRVVVPDGAPACGGTDDGGCQAVGFEACNEGQGRCGVILCTKEHDRVVDVYNSVPFTASAWKQVAGADTGQVGGFVYSFKPQMLVGQGRRIPVGCTDDQQAIFDAAGKFVPNPGASTVYYTFDQGFGVGATRSNPAFFNFGRDEVSVTMVKPQPDEAVKILFYRLGGLCNANRWLSAAYLMPKDLAGGGAPPPGVGPVGPTPAAGTSPAPALAPAATPTPATAQISAAQQSTVVAAVGKLVSLPTAEAPNVIKVVDSRKLVVQPKLAAVQNDDVILIYPEAKQVIVYRPQTNTIVVQLPTIPIALRNGTTGLSLFAAFEQDLLQNFPQVTIAERSGAKRRDYQKTLLIDPRETKPAQVQELARLLRLDLSRIPPDEAAPSADFLIIVGGPKIALRNGTTSPTSLDAYERELRQKLVTVTITDKKAALAGYQTTFLVDLTGRNTYQAKALSSLLGIPIASLPAGEAALVADFMIIVGEDRK